MPRLAGIQSIPLRCARSWSVSATPSCTLPKLQMEGESNLLKFSQVFHLMPVATSFVVTNGAHMVVCAPGAFPTYAVQCCATAKRARRTATYDPAPPLIRRYVPLELRLRWLGLGGAFVWVQRVQMCIVGLDAWSRAFVCCGCFDRLLYFALQRS